MHTMESDSMIYKELRITNFKRFAGEHVFPLTGEGNVTIIAAKNGVGKTTVLDAFNVVLHGTQGIKVRYSKTGFRFENWIRKAFNTTVDDEDCQVGFQLTLVDPTLGEILIRRDYWFERNGGPVDMELTVRVNGKPLPLEEGETKQAMAQKWIEAFIPLAVSQRFLFDGEQLPELDVGGLNDEFREGLDDILGQQAIQQLNNHLNSVMKNTSKQMTPEDEQMKIEDLFNQTEIARVKERSLEDEMAEKQKLLDGYLERSNSLQELIVSKGNAEGGDLGDVRSKQAIAASHLAGRRMELIRVISESLPFMIAGMPNELDDWGITEARNAIENNLVAASSKEIIERILPLVKPKIPDLVGAGIRKALDEELMKQSSDVPAMYQFLNKDDLNAIITIHSLMEEDLSGRAKKSVSDCLIALKEYKMATADMIAESEKLGLVGIANEYREVSTKVGETREEIRVLKSSLDKTTEFITNTEQTIFDMQSLSQKDSKLNKRLELILTVRKLILEYASKKRESLSKPLEQGFEDGFKLLSRKASAVESVTISPSDYSPLIEMKGYDGNWLDRDLSATEKQHVGLAMLYAICKISRTSLPVVVDTPVSRMDKEHKGWSVTKFYPKLSHQVIVLTTSDDLSDGLFDELKEANCIGSQILLEETGPATARAVTTTLEGFF